MRRSFQILLTLSWALLMSGCARISVAPSCPSELEIGESATLQANEQNPGAIPTYKWEVLPSEAGEFDPSDAPVTSFLAKEFGQATIRLTAADGLYQVTAICDITIVEAGDVAVSLSVDPEPPIVGEQATVVCRSVGETVAETRTMEQADGAPVELTFASEGVATFTPGEPGDLTFTCIGLSAGSRESEASTLTVTVVSPSDNDDDNGGREPIRPGRP